MTINSHEAAPFLPSTCLSRICVITKYIFNEKVILWHFSRVTMYRTASLEKSYVQITGKGTTRMSNFPAEIPTTVALVTYKIQARVNATFLVCRHSSVGSDVKAITVIMLLLSGIVAPK